MIEMIFKNEGNLKELMHNALVGSPGYKGSEIMISDGDKDDEFLLIIGNNNHDDLRIAFK